MVTRPPADVHPPAPKNLAARARSPWSFSELSCIGEVRFTLAHPTNPELHAEYGFDPTPLVQWFTEIYLAPRAQPLVVYDALQRCYDPDQPLFGALRFLVEQTFFSSDDLDAAIEAFGAPYSVRLSRSARRALEVLENFKAASE